MKANKWRKLKEMNEECGKWMKIKINAGNDAKQLKLMKLSGVLSGDKPQKKEKIPAKKAETSPPKKATAAKEKTKWA